MPDIWYYRAAPTSVVNILQEPSFFNLIAEDKNNPTISLSYDSTEVHSTKIILVIRSLVHWLPHTIIVSDCTLFLIRFVTKPSLVGSRLSNFI